MTSWGSIPFTFLSSLLGIDGEKLKHVEFEAGEFKVLPPQKEKLDNIIKILTKRSKLSLGITGSYNTQKDTEAIQSNKLRNLILQKSANKGVVIANVLEDIYTAHVGKDVVKTLKTKIRKKYKEDEIFNIKYQKELMKICKDIQEVTSKELVDLADKRAYMIQEYLILTKTIDITRTILHKVQEVDSEKFIETELEIEVK
ncbi:MAG: hypothetical protein L3J10_04040 [Sulfurimonas sp.]|nr:hypothetical protein [Sulfurimonas sp.]